MRLSPQDIDREINERIDKDLLFSRYSPERVSVAMEETIPDVLDECTETQTNRGVIV
jgi:hypothetical protein